MKIKPNVRFSLPPFLLLIPVLLLSACAPAASVDDFTIPRQASSTPLALPGAAQPTQPDVTPIPIQVQVRLEVIKARAQILWGGSMQSNIHQAQSADLKINNGIEMVKLDGQNQQSYGILSLPDFVNVELFANTKLYLADAKQGPMGFADITLDLENGHIFVHLNEKRNIHVTIRTPHATIKTLTNDAEFDVCRSEERTCVMVKTGIVEVVAQSRREIVRAGSAGVVSSDESLSPGICAPTATFIAWEEQYRQSANAPALLEEIARLPEKPCPITAEGFPLNARILYQDEFTTASRGWDQGKTDRFTIGYFRSDGARYYQVRVQGVEDRYLALVPNGRVYQDVNIDLKTRTESASSGDFRYGIVFRRSGEQYYAFLVSPRTEAWYFLKSSPTGMEILKYGVEKRMRGLAGQDTLRVESHGSTFLVFINGRFIDWISDSDYASGEVGLLVDSINNSDALINFNSITIWDIPVPVFSPAQGENCFNVIHDDGDGRIDQADSNCKGQELIATALPISSPLPTNPPRTSVTPTALPATKPPVPTATSRPPVTQPTIVLPLPTQVLPLPTLPLPIPTIVLPLPTISLPLPLAPPGTPILD